MGIPLSPRFLTYPEPYHHLDERPRKHQAVFQFIPPGPPASRSRSLCSKLRPQQNRTAGLERIGIECDGEKEQQPHGRLGGPIQGRHLGWQRPGGGEVDDGRQGEDGAEKRGGRGGCRESGGGAGLVVGFGL